MNARPIRLAAMVVGFSLATLLAACASPAAVPSPGIASPPAALSDPARTARLLASADLALEAGRMDDVRTALASLDALGARSLDDRDPLSEWRDAADYNEPAMRGRTLGPGYRRGILEAGETVRLEQSFLSGERAMVSLSGSQASRLTLRVSQPDDRPVCAGSSPPVDCSWLPLITQRFTIQVSNRGPDRASYYLVTN